MAKVLCYDIDGVLTIESHTVQQDLPGTYIYRSPNPLARRQIYRAIRCGFTVILFTGRRENQRRITEDWLAAHNFQYHYLLMGKPYFNYIVDDRARTIAQIEDLLDECDPGASMRDLVPPEPVEEPCFKPAPFLDLDFFDDLIDAMLRNSIAGLDALGIELFISFWKENNRRSGKAKVYALLNEVSMWFRKQLEERMEPRLEGRARPQARGPGGQRGNEKKVKSDEWRTWSDKSPAPGQGEPTQQE